MSEKESTIHARLIDLNDYNLAFRVGKDEAGDTSGVSRLREQIKQADGIILGTPEYHGSLSGVLKNALYLMGFDEFEGKMIGLVGVFRKRGRFSPRTAKSPIRNWKSD
jgi:FMN reductase